MTKRPRRGDDCSRSQKGGYRLRRRAQAAAAPGGLADACGDRLAAGLVPRNRDEAVTESPAALPLSLPPPLRRSS